MTPLAKMRADLKEALREAEALKSMREHWTAAQKQKHAKRCATLEQFCMDQAQELTNKINDRITRKNHGTPTA